MLRDATGSLPLVAQIHEIARPDVEALGLERTRHEGPHRHVCVVGRDGALLAEPLAEVERELDDFLCRIP
jgi:hypothetical protein